MRITGWKEFLLAIVAPVAAGAAMIAGLVWKDTPRGKGTAAGQPCHICGKAKTDCCICSTCSRVVCGDDCYGPILVHCDGPDGIACVKCLDDVEAKVQTSRGSHVKGQRVVRTIGTLDARHDMKRYALFLLRKKALARGANAIIKLNAPDHVQHVEGIAVVIEPGEVVGESER